MSKPLHIAPEIVQGLDEEVGQLRQMVTFADETLDHYAHEYCEGWCKDCPPEVDFGENCGGCRARLALKKINDVAARTFTAAQSQQEPLWHRVQDRIDAWAQETLGEDAGVIMSWSDRLAQHLAPELAAQPPAAPVETETRDRAFDAYRRTTQRIGEAREKLIAKQRAEIERCMDMLGDVPGGTLEERLTHYIGSYMALQVCRSSAETGEANGSLVEKLRAVDHGSVEDCFCQSPLFTQAADEIERLRAALQGVLDAAENGDEMTAVSMAEAALESHK